MLEIVAWVVALLVVPYLIQRYYRERTAARQADLAAKRSAFRHLAFDEEGRSDFDVEGEP